MLGSGGREYVEWAAELFTDDQFRDFYEHRARMLLAHHSGKLGMWALARLTALLND